MSASRSDRDGKSAGAPRVLAARAGSLERSASQGRDLGMAGVRGRRVRAKRRGRDQDAGHQRHRGRGIQPRRQGHQRGVAQARGRDGARPEQERASRPARLPCGGGRCPAPPGQGARDPRLRGPLQTGQPRTDLKGRALGADPVPDRGRRRPGPGPRGTRARRREGRQRRAPELRVRPVRGRQRGEAARGGDQRRLRQGTGHVASDHDADPADRLRRRGGGRRAAAPGDHRGHRDDRPDRPAQPC